MIFSQILRTQEQNNFCKVFCKNEDRYISVFFFVFILLFCRVGDILVLIKAIYKGICDYGTCY